MVLSVCRGNVYIKITQNGQFCFTITWLIMVGIPPNLPVLFSLFESRLLQHFMKDEYIGTASYIFFKFVGWLVSENQAKIHNTLILL